MQYTELFKYIFHLSFEGEEGSGIDHRVLAQLTQLYMTVKLECPFYDVSETALLLLFFTMLKT